MKLISFNSFDWMELTKWKDIITVIRLILSITKTIAEIIDEFDEMIMKSNESIMKAFVERNRWN